MTNPLIHVFIGTKAQYIKTAPLLRHLEESGTEYRLIDSGQHAALARDLRVELGVGEPDHQLGGTANIDTIPGAIAWAARLGLRLLRRSQLSSEVFGGHSGICVVHGDTPSTLLSALMARRAGLSLAHIEAGLRSHSIRHPFPEELIRIIVMRMSQILFAPDDTAVANLRRMRVRGRVVRLDANTNVEALARSLPELPPPRSGPVVVTSHRVENLRSRTRLARLVDIATELGESMPVVFVLHGPTEQTLLKRNLMHTLVSSQTEILPLQPHAEFTRMLAAAPFVITDGGSIQEECALLGVPTLLWRERTEREDGLGRNILLSRFDRATVAGFIADHEKYRQPPAEWSARPSTHIADVLLETLGSSG